MLKLQFFNKIPKYILYITLFWLSNYFILIKILLNQSKITHINIKCKTFKIFCNVQWCKEVKSN